jgi:DNA-binding transcriptional ArsR family regulator
MSAMPENIVPFQLPKKPRVRQKEAPPDQRSLAVIPIRAGTDERLHGAALRCLIVLCSYCNRAGLTWVGQARLAQDLKISRQAVTKQLAVLREHGYIEITRKGFRGERANTLRVIFDPSVDADTAIAITSAQEDTRPPAIRQEQAMQAEEVDRQGQQRIAQMLAKALKPTVTKKEYTMPKSGDTRAVKEIKEAMQKAKEKRSHRQPPEVANVETPKVANEELHRQPHRQPPEVARTQKEHIDKVNYEDKVINKPKCVLGNLERVELREQGLTDDEIDGNLEILLAAYQAEGLTPNPERLATEIADLAKVGRGIV